jgi:hypothetical protein
MRVYFSKHPRDAWVVVICSELSINRGQGIFDATERLAAEILVAHLAHPEPETQANGAAEPVPAEETLSVSVPSHHQFPDELQDTLFERPAPEVLSNDDAAPALRS